MTSAAKPKNAQRPRAANKRATKRSINDFVPLLAAEERLLSACSREESLVLSPTRPSGATAQNRIRASFLRFLALGGDEQHPVRERGIEVSGAFIDGELDVSFCKIQIPIALRRCMMSHGIDATAAVIDELALDGSSVPGISADRFKCTGTLFLRNGFLSEGEVRLINAEIGGSLNCHRGKFINPGRDCISADGIYVGGQIHFDNSHFEGCVRLLGARIEGNLDCQESSFNNAGEIILSCDGATIQDGLFWREMKSINGGVDLTTCYAAVLVDDIESWMSCSYIEMDGFRYDRIIGFSDSKDRIAWLRKQREESLRADFCPQPWEQLARILRETGHVEAARNISIEKHWAMARAGKIGQRAVEGVPWLRRQYHASLNEFSRILHVVYGVLAGFGHRPLWTVGWMIAVWIAAGSAYQLGDQHGVFGPSSPIIQTSATTENCGAPGDTYLTPSQIGGKVVLKRAVPWTHCPSVPAAYTTFHPYVYSLDLLLPVIDLQQQDAWSPMVNNRAGQTLWWGRLMRWLLWGEILFGWLSGALLVAVLGKFVNRD